MCEYIQEDDAGLSSSKITRKADRQFLFNSSGSSKKKMYYILFQKLRKTKTKKQIKKKGKTKKE